MGLLASQSIKYFIVVDPLNALGPFLLDLSSHEPLHKLLSSLANGLNELLLHSENTGHRLSVIFRSVINNISDLVQRH